MLKPNVDKAEFLKDYWQKKPILIKKFFNNTLKIRDSELEYLEWKEILDIYSDTSNDFMNPFYIDSIITTKENYFIALIDNKIIRPYHLNSIFEWNLMYCTIYSFLENSEKISDNIFKNPKILLL